MLRNSKVVKGIRCTYTDKIVTIEKSYKIRYDDVADFCVELRNALPFTYKRSVDSWTKEVIAHNFFYEINIIRSHSENTDIDENESFLRLFVYDIVYLMYRISRIEAIMDFIFLIKRR